MEVIEMKNKSFFATLVFIVIFGIGIILAYSMNKVSIVIKAGCLDHIGPDRLRLTYIT